MVAMLREPDRCVTALRRAPTAIPGCTATALGYRVNPGPTADRVPNGRPARETQNAPSPARLRQASRGSPAPAILLPCSAVRQDGTGSRLGLGSAVPAFAQSRHDTGGAGSTAAIGRPPPVSARDGMHRGCL